MLARGVLEEAGKRDRSSGLDGCEKQINLVADGVVVIDNFAKSVILKFIKDVLERLDQVKNADVAGERPFLIFGRFNFVGLANKMILLPGFFLAEKMSGLFEFLVFNELSNEIPAGIIFLGLFLLLVDCLPRLLCFSRPSNNGWKSRGEESRGEEDDEVRA